MILAEKLSKIYGSGTKGLLSLDLKINPGEFVAIIGPSGSGKTTLLKQINGTILPSSGNLEVLGTKIQNASESELRKLRTQIGFIFQQFNLVKNLTVTQNILTGRLGYYSDFSGTLGLFSKEDKKAAAQLIEELGLGGRGDSRVDQLSGGQQQRVAIARALIQDPKIILADEPMASLDPKTSENILKLLKDFNQKKGNTIIVNIHVLDLAKKYATRLLGLKAGKLVFDGPPSKLNEAALNEIYGVQ